MAAEGPYCCFDCLTTIENQSTTGLCSRIFHVVAVPRHVDNTTPTAWSVDRVSSTRYAAQKRRVSSMDCHPFLGQMSVEEDTIRFVFTRSPSRCSDRAEGHYRTDLCPANTNEPR